MLGLQNILDLAELELKKGPHPHKARLDSERLLLHVLGKDRAWLIAHRHRSMHYELFDRFSQLTARRRRGEPIQYITGEAEFYGLPFRVTPAVLIPRPETEHSVEKVIALCQGIHQPRIVDIGTGSGAIAVTLAHQLPHAQVTATDIFAQALAIARENATRNGVGERIRFLEGDLLAPIAGERFDIVASNPPYVSIGDRDTLDIEVREFEPHTALFAGPDGLYLYRRLIPQAAESLAPGGHIVIEIGYDQRDDLHNLLSATGYTSIEFVPDLRGIARVAVARRP
jgi:release factor glutamine methyltransferase